MHRIRTAATAAITAALVAATALAAAPSASAAEFSMPAPTVSFSVANQGSATSTSGVYLWLNADTALQAVVGSTIIGSEGTITFADGQLPDGRTLTWYSCPTRGSSLANCTNARTQTVAGANASGTSFLYTPTADDIGRYLAYEVTQKIATIAGALTRTTVSDRAKDVQVIAALGTTARPAWGVTGVQAGGKASLLLFPWTLPSGSTFVSRTLAVHACPRADQGQGSAPGYDITGCTEIPVASITGGTVNANTASAFQVQTTADMAGKTLLAGVNLVSRTANGTVTIYTIRSAGATLPGAGATPTPTPTPSASASADAGAVPNQIPTGSPSAGTLAATAVVPKVKIVAVKTMTRGKATGVAIELSGRGKGTVGTGSAIVELVKTGAPGEKAAQKLKTTSVKGMKGFQKQTVSKKLKKGTYYLRVIYTDAKSKVQAGALKKVSVK